MDVRWLIRGWAVVGLCVFASASGSQKRKARRMLGPFVSDRLQPNRHRLRGFGSGAQPLRLECSLQGFEVALLDPDGIGIPAFDCRQQDRP